MTDDDRCRDGDAVAAFPLWMVAYKAAEGLARDARSVITAQRGSARAVLVLTHPDQAERFIRKQGQDDLVALSLSTLVDLVGLLEAMEGAGVSHVQFDEHPGSPVVPIAGVLAIARRSSQETAIATDMQRCLRLPRRLCEDVAIEFWTLPMRAVAGQYDLPPLEASYRCDYCGQEHFLRLPQAAHVWPTCPNCGKTSYLSTE